MMGLTALKIVVVTGAPLQVLDISTGNVWLGLDYIFILGATIFFIFASVSIEGVYRVSYQSCHMTS